MAPDDDFLVAVLDAIEQREARLLAWGLVDFYLTSAELHSLIDPLLDEAMSSGVNFFGAAEVMDALLERALLFDVGDEDEQRYRSRMAEAVRLSFRLRQLFPRHQGPVNWQTAPTLVADFRFLWRRRRYPRRDIEPAHALGAISEAAKDPRAQRALEALLDDFTPPLELANFQVKATARILSSFTGRSTATLVSAGTGSGKTLAFYLPALSRVAAQIEADAAAARWVKVLALYPRNELLKDQFAEVYAQARRLDAYLAAKGRRKILIGTFFGPTPTTAAYAHETRSGWSPASDGIACEFVRCPTPNCLGDMVWRETDRKAKRERLFCAVCDSTIGEDEVVLTRERLERESPDILFTTTEMLNQRIGDAQFRHLFGLGPKAPRAVEMMLLDEVHTYAGTSGAQVAYLIRRWRWLLRRPVSFVGLSATLKDGARFFARLTGLSEAACAEIVPASGEMIAEGAEYMLALRGDPVSRTALLSTTIQTAILFSRILDQPAARKSGGLFGERLFLFTDDIDVTNRMYFALLDAEGRDRTGNPDLRTKRNGGLAVLRFPMSVEARKRDGQDWIASTQIGHSLQADDRKAVGRVMSMDPGVGNNLDMIVATAALEVGFNDPRVGAVLQHKAPRDVAQFLQRKGRAGRSRQMRPWTVAILSDYGRDRIAYQGYDLLFDPELPVRSLPTSNRYIMRMQAVYATLDYLSQTVPSEYGSIWQDLSAPGEKPAVRQRQARLATALQRILSSAAEREAFAEFLGRALRLQAHDVEALLWEQPRPLLTEVIPTALRRLQSNWRWQGAEASEQWQFNAPLPEFAPANLFSHLNLPEVRIPLPATPAGTDREDMVMPIAQAMRDFAPGRVSRRFGLRHERERHWLTPDLDPMREQAVPLSNHVEADPLGTWLIHVPGGIARVPAFRPRALKVTNPPFNVVDTSNARLHWRGQILARNPGLTLAGAGAWEGVIEGLIIFTHERNCPVEVRRMALGSLATILFKDGTSAVKDFFFEADGERAALGFSMAVDAVFVKLAVPHDLWRRLGPPGELLYRATRTAFFNHMARNGSELSAIDNVFAREWLGQLLLSTLASEAMTKGVDLMTALDNLRSGRADLDLDATLTLLFQSPIVDDANAQGNLQDRLRQDLGGYLADPQIVSRLLSLGRLLFEDADEAWEDWLRGRFKATVAAAALHAIQSLCPEIDTADLVVDVDGGPREDGDALGDADGIWISESSPGGNGHIEEVHRVFAEDPRRFITLMAAALGDSDFGLSDFQLQRFVTEVTGGDPDEQLRELVREMREADGADATHAAFTALRHRLADQGYITAHSFMVALGNRVLRPGSSQASDQFLAQSLQFWDNEEQRLGIELDARAIAYRLSRSADIDAVLQAAGMEAPTHNPEQWRFSAIYGLLWPRGAYVRTAGLALYSSFADLPGSDPLIVRPFVQSSASPLDLEDPSWREKCLEQLAQAGSATLDCPAALSGLMADALTFLATNPVQSDYLSVFARTQAIRRAGDRLQADVDVAEALQ